MPQKKVSEMTKAELLKHIKEQEALEPTNIHEAMNALMGRVGYVQKQEASGLPYSFAGERAFIVAIRPHMVDLGITIHQSGAELVSEEIFQTKKGAMAFNRVYLFEWVFTHTPSGTQIAVTSLGEGTDYGDKCAYKCMTGGLKYALRQSLIIETGDDPDDTSSDEFQRAVEQKKDEGYPSGDGRVENQWEKPIIEKAVELQLVQAAPHAVNILNNSSLFSIPMGTLPTEVGIAYLVAHKKVKEAEPDMSVEERRELVERGWADTEKSKKLITQAKGMLGIELEEGGY